MIPSADGIYYVDHSDTWDFDDGFYISVYPENCTFDHQIRGVGNISYQISLSAIDADGAPVVTGHDFIAPMRSYWRLRYGNDVILSGVITSCRVKEGDDYMSVAGKTWEHFFERWQYPFDPRPTHVNDFAWPNTFQNDESVASGAATPTGLQYQALNRDVIQIWADLLATIMNVPNRVPLDMTDLLSGISGIKTNYNLSLGDDSTAMDIVNGLADTGNGFDWWVGWDRAIHWGSPYRFGTTASPFIFFTLDSSIIVENLEFENSGPDNTHVLGRGAGLASQTTLQRAFGYGPAQTQWSRLDRSVDVGDVRNVNQLIKRTQKELSRGVNPKHDIPLSLNPDSITDFWNNFRTGRAIYIDRELIYHRIDSPQQLLSYNASLDNERGAKVDFTLSQIYDYSLNAGTPEG
jgi:hypothetical protein